MISKATDVETYIATLPYDRQPAVAKLQSLCTQLLVGFEECMEYGMPAYKRNGKVEIAYASQKQYIALYVMHKDIVDEFRPALSAAKIGKGCIRFTKPEKIDFEIVKQLLSRTAKSKSQPC